MIRALLWRLLFEVLHLVRALGPGRPGVLYFAFGANLDPQVLARRKINVFSEREFVLKDFEMRFSHQGPYKGMGYASIEASAGALTYGKLYTISRLDALRLDFYEGAWFINRYRSVKHRQDDLQFYFYQTRSPRLNLKPTADYLGKMARGFALLSDVPRPYLDWLETHETVEPLLVCDDVGFCFRVRETWPKAIAKALQRYDQFVVGVFAKYIRDTSLTVRLIRSKSTAAVPSTSTPIIGGDAAKEDVFDLIARLRSPDALRSAATLQALSQGLEPYAEFKEVAAFRHDLARIVSGGTADFSRSRDANVAGESGFLIAFLSAPYNKDLGLECLLYDDCPIPKPIADAFASVARPVKARRYSQGFRSDLAVAIFPENFVHAGEVPSDARSFYFIDKFVRRCQDKTVPFILERTSLRSLPYLKTASTSQLETAAAIWVYLHEHFHRQGDFPLPEFLSLKSSKSTAGLEELRVDLLAMLACTTPVVRQSCDAAMLEEFILAERLFRYGAERCPNADYDSRGAHVFYRYLESAGAISERNDLMDVDMLQFRKLAANLSQDIERLEQQIVAKSFAEAKESLTAYVKDMAAYDPEAKAFPRGKFYARPSSQ